MEISLYDSPLLQSFISQPIFSHILFMTERRLPGLPRPHNVAHLCRSWSGTCNCRNSLQIKESNEEMWLEQTTKNQVKEPGTAEHVTLIFPSYKQTVLVRATHLSESKRRSLSRVVAGRRCIPEEMYGEHKHGFRGICMLWLCLSMDVITDAAHVHSEDSKRNLHSDETLSVDVACGVIKGYFQVSCKVN